jgi:hypothetical protein
VFGDTVPVDRVHFPSETVAGGIWLAIVEREDGPDAVEAGLAEQLGAGQRLVPLGKI